MGRKIDSIEKEIDEIRLRIYERIKDMTPAEMNEYYNKSTEATIKKYGMRVVTSVDDI
jgi:hypothetical protein